MHLCCKRRYIYGVHADDTLSSEGDRERATRPPSSEAHMRRCDAYRKRRGKEASKEEGKKCGVGGELVEPEVEVRVGPEREREREREREM